MEDTGRHSSTEEREPGSPPLLASVLDADDDLAEELDVRMRFAASQLATARLIDVECGPCQLGGWFAAAGCGPGLLILDGLLAVETCIADRTATELLGAGDLVQPVARRVDDLLERSARWRALQRTR